MTDSPHGRGVIPCREVRRVEAPVLIECNDGRGPQRYEMITPREPDRRGCQLSILAHDKPKALFKALAGEGVVCDFREPNVVRVAPVPLYNTFHEVWRFARVLNRMV